PTMLDAIRQGRIPAEARVSPTPSRAQAEGVRVQPAEELTPEEVDLVDDATIPEELRGTTPSQLPEESKGTKEQADASMYKLTKQNQPKLHKVNEKKGVLDLLLSEDSIKKPGETLKELGSKARRSELAKDLSGDESGLGSIRLGLRQRTLDSAAAILKQAENLFRKDGNPVWVETATSAITAVRDSYKSNELLSQALNVGYIYLDRKTGFFMVKADKNYAMMPAMKKLSSKGKLYQGWDAAIAQRFVDIENSGRDAKKMLGGDFTLKEAQDTVNSYRNDADIQEFLKVYKNFNDSLIDLNRYVGNFDPKLAATLKSWYYSPYYRVPLDEDGNLEAPNVGSSRLTNLASLKKISGRERAINDMIENFIVNAQYMAGYAMKNEAAIRTIRDSVAANNAKRIASPSDAVQKDRVVRINDRGQKAYYEIEDPLLYQAMNSSQVRLGSMVNLGRGFAQALRSGVTSAPTFMFNNMFLDSFRLYYMGIYQDNFVKSIVGNIAQGIGSVYKGMRFGTDPVYDKLLNAGLITNNFASRDAVQSAKEIKRQLAVEQGSAIANFFRTFKNYTLGKLETASRASEAVNRVQVYKNVYKNLRKEGATDAEAESSALFAAMQYPVNFDIRGSGRIVQYATALIPFVNASAQGTDVFYTNVKEVWKTKAKGLKPINKLQASSLEAAKRTMLSSFGLATLYAFGMALSDDEEYKALPLSERFRTLLIPIPGSAATVKIPVPPEIGAVTLMLPVAAAEAIMGMDNGPQIAKAMFAYFTNLFTFSPIPQVVKPALEVAVNRDLYSGRPIENQAMQRILPQYRYEESSSSFSKGIADVAASMKLPISPIQFDHLIRGYFGTLGMYLSDVSGQLYDPQNKDIDRLKLSDPYLLPFIGKKFASPVDRKAMDDYYEIRNAATQAANTLKMIEASKVYEENPGKLREMAYMAKVNEAMEAGPEKEMEELRKLKAQVLSAPRDHINPSQKTEIIKQINLRMNEVARGVQPLKRYIPFTLF
ncbi:MAG: LPD38 domain-containing protein, partial [bacterium]